MKLFQRLTPQMLGRVQRLPDGQPTVFHEKLEWKSPSKLRSYSLANLHYQPRQREIKVTPSIQFLFFYPNRLDFKSKTTFA